MTPTMDAPINVCCAFDHAMAVPALVVAASIQQSMRPGRRVIFHAIATDNQALDQSEAGRQLNSESFEFRPLLVPESKTIKMDLSDSVLTSRAACVRLSLPDILAEAERIIYLDADVVVHHPLDELFDVDMGGQLICACPDYPLIKSLRHSRAVSSWTASVALQSAPASYFNTGILLLDCKKWRRGRYSEKCQAIAERHGSLFFGDQDLLNILVQGAYRKLDPRWNAFARYHDPRWRAFAHYPATPEDPEDEAIARAIADPWITHFAGLKKPWVFQKSAPAVEKFWTVVNASPFRDQASSLCRQSQRRHALKAPLKKISEFLMTVSRGLSANASRLPPATLLSKRMWLFASKLYRLSD
jgi:lipopolysaccharide biosynthesis glycosyltransferase